MNAPPKVSIIILNWNGRDDTLACLDSVFKIDYPNFDVVVVDNGSTDDSVPAIRKAFPQAHLIETGKNLGYAGGNNVGIQYALNNKADYIFVLNNDTTVAPDVLTHLVQAAEKHPEAAVLGPVIYEMERPETIWTAGEAFGEGFTCVHLRQGESETVLNKDDGRTVDWVTGAAFFTRSSALRDIGLFDERYFLVYEESDWCFRARRAGYSCLIVPQASVWHKVGSAFGSESSPLRTYFSTRNRLLFAEQNLPKRAEGFGVVVGRDLLIGDDAESFASQVCALLDSFELYNRIAKSGYDFIKHNYSLPAVKLILDSTLEHLAGLPPRKIRLSHRLTNYFKHLYERHLTWRLPN
ncbi:glycosyltransferase family 2 protein [Methylohalobius crimeensis]|uniref:glycosyltransferase family 2 protein n=1 Tax=Methylohalobius crimeensis TaxID=244365 RepID=UPI0003B3429D|nr:glycosyltransferase family 2 protein [Methylohalobius crimeensis]